MLLYTSKVYTGMFTYIILLLIYVVVCYCVVSIYSTVCTAVPCCLFHTTAHHELPTMSIGKLARTLYSKLDSKNRASELAKHSRLPSTPAPRTTQCYFPRPLLYLRRAVAITARSEDRQRPLRSPLFLCSRGRVGARACVCVFKCSYVEPSNIAINRADNEWVQLSLVNCIITVRPPIWRLHHAARQPFEHIHLKWRRA